MTILLPALRERLALGLRLEGVAARRVRVPGRGCDTRSAGVRAPPRCALTGLDVRAVLIAKRHLIMEGLDSYSPTMSASTAPYRTNLADQLPAAVYYQLIHSLCLTLPPPVTDSPEDLARRNGFAIARIAELHPTTALEADQAALYVAATEQWKDCLRLAQRPDTSADRAAKCRAQANSMMRQAQGALRLLLRLQAKRQRTEADSEAGDRTARAEHRAISLMTRALSPRPAPAASTNPAAPPAPQSEPALAAKPQPAPLAEARQSAAIYADHAPPLGTTRPLPGDLLATTVLNSPLAALEHQFPRARAA